MACYKPKISGQSETRRGVLEADPVWTQFLKRCRPLLCHHYQPSPALGWKLEIALYVFTLQLHATLNALQEHGDHPAINWVCFLGKEVGDSYWGDISVAWFLNGPEGHLVTSVLSEGDSSTKDSLLSC